MVIPANDLGYLERILKKNKTAYAHWGDEVDGIYTSIIGRTSRMNSRFVTKSKNAMFSTTLGWHVERWTSRKLPVRMNRILEAGYVKYWNEIKRYLLTLSRLRDTRRLDLDVNIKVLNMEDNIVVVFMVYASLFPILLIAITIELLMPNAQLQILFQYWKEFLYIYYLHFRF